MEGGGSQFDWYIFFTANLPEWLTNNLESQDGLLSNGMNWPTQFSILCWLLWKCRNNFIFNNSHSNIDVVVDTNLIWIESFDMFKSSELYRIQVNFKDHWNKPKLGWIKLNTDEAFSDTMNIASIGGVF